MAFADDPEITDPKRARQFIGYFRNYMGLSTIAVAALPVPIAQLDMIPIYEPDRDSTSVITSLLCFLILAFIFYSRHSFAKTLFHEHRLAASEAQPRRSRFRPTELELRARRKTLFWWLILFLILLSVGLFFTYIYLWMVEDYNLRALSHNADPALARHAGSFDPFARLQLMASYTGFFATAEAAFVLMATKEYLQDLLRFSDQDLIYGLRAQASAGKPLPASAPSAIEGEAGRARDAAGRSDLPV